MSRLVILFPFLVLPAKQAAVNSGYAKELPSFGIPCLFDLRKRSRP